MAAIAKRITVHGRVQGVGFRMFVNIHAKRLLLDGFVRNRNDGTVEVLCVGDEMLVQELIRACENGPEGALVERVDVQAAEGIVGKGFQQLPTV